MWREIKRLDDIDNRSKEDEKRLDDFKNLFNYYGEATCAADGMCQEKCPVKINTGEMIKVSKHQEPRHSSAPPPSVHLQLLRLRGVCPSIRTYMVVCASENVRCNALIHSPVLRVQ